MRCAIFKRVAKCGMRGTCDAVWVTHTAMRLCVSVLRVSIMSAPREDPERCAPGPSGAQGGSKQGTFDCVTFGVTYEHLAIKMCLYWLRLLFSYSLTKHPCQTALFHWTCLRESVCGRKRARGGAAGGECQADPVTLSRNQGSDTESTEPPTRPQARLVFRGNTKAQLHRGAHLMAPELFFSLADSAPRHCFPSPAGSPARQV